MSVAVTPAAYVAALPDDRRKALTAIRKVINANLPKGYKEGIQYNMIGWFVPHSVYPAGYHCDPAQPLPFMSLASQKGHIGLYLFCVYISPELLEWFTSAWKATGKKLDMGKSCVRVKDLDGVPLDVVGDLVRRIPVDEFIESYERALTPRIRASRTSAAKAPIKKAAAKKPIAASKAGTKKSSARTKPTKSG